MIVCIVAAFIAATAAGLWAAGEPFGDELSRGTFEHTYATAQGRAADTDWPAFTLADFVGTLERTVGRWALTELRLGHWVPAEVTAEDLLRVRGSLQLKEDVEIAFAGSVPQHQRQAVWDAITTRIAEATMTGGAWLQLAAEHSFTITLRDADGRHPGLADLAQRARERFGLESGVSVYYTPPGLPGVPQHVDLMDVFALQVHGSKRWLVQHSTVPCPEEPVRLTPTLHRGPANVIELRAGDALYVPRGVIHNATAGIEGSLHVSLGIEPKTQKVLGRLLLRVATDLAPTSELPRDCFQAPPAVAVGIAIATARRWSLRRAVSTTRPFPACGAWGVELRRDLQVAAQLVSSLSAREWTDGVDPAALAARATWWYEVCASDPLTAAAHGNVTQAETRLAVSELAQVLEDKSIEATLCRTAQTWLRELDAEEARDRALEAQWLELNRRALDANAGPPSSGEL